MTTEFTVGKLTATRRTSTGKGQARKLRDQGKIPAICYGLKEESISLVLNPLELRGALDPDKVRNTLIDLTIQDADNALSTKVMLKDIQIDSLKDNILHADFIRVDEDKPIEVAVPLRTEGKPEGVKIGGTLHQVFRMLPVKCLPADIPVSLSVDVAALELNESVSVKDLIALDEKIEVLLPLNKTIALVMSPRTSTEDEEAEAAEGEEGEGAGEGEGEKGAEGDKPAEKTADGKPGADTTKKK